MTKGDLKFSFLLVVRRSFDEVVCVGKFSFSATFFLVADVEYRDGASSVQ